MPYPYFTPTKWHELDNRFEIIEVFIPQEGNWHGGRSLHRQGAPLIGQEMTLEHASIRIRHPELKRPRYFVKSRRGGNWYSRYTGRNGAQQAEGFIIKDIEHLESLASDWLEEQKGA